jgi:predicted heme/steroid binding protein
MDKEDVMEQRVFTADELATFDGKDGRPAYIAMAGKVYDVSDSSMWEDGLHGEEHDAGADLTDDMDFAPHNDSVLEDFPVVGTLEE